MEIQVAYTSIEADIYKVTGSHGKKAGDVERIAGTSEDSALKVFFGECADVLLGVLGNYGSLTSTGDTIKFLVTTPANFPTNLSTTISDSCKSFVTNYVISRWFLSVGDSANAQAYEAKCEGIEKTIKINLNKRTKTTIS